MIMSETSNRPTPLWVQACVLLCAWGVISLGVTYAQDYEAVGKRLQKAVHKGEITKQQAGAMMAAVKGKPTEKKPHDKVAGVKKETVQRKGNIDLNAAWEKLQAMVKAGKLTEKQAHAKMEALLEKMSEGD